MKTDIETNTRTTFRKVWSCYFCECEFDSHKSSQKHEKKTTSLERMTAI